jgi:hypothetical protein
MLNRSSTGPESTLPSDMFGSDLPANCYVHVLDDGERCGDGKLGDVCIVRYDEHYVHDVEFARGLRNALDEAINAHD